MLEQNDNTFLNALKNPAIYPHPVKQIQMLETHISWVFLTGDYVYKIKKPVDLGFLDFSSLEKRHWYCKEEVRLNRRLAPEYYLDVIAITGSMTQPSLAQDGKIVEYAVKMRQFPQQAQLDKLVQNNQLTDEHVLLLAEKIAAFHSSIDIAGDDKNFGNPEQIFSAVENCYLNILNNLHDAETLEKIHRLHSWSKKSFQSQQNLFLERKAKGFVRECHGDLHLRNIAIDHNQVIAFDCIEFSADLRWNDVISEIAFLIMDLDDRDHCHLANIFLNRYLEITGDYSGLQVLPYYLVYRAIVRAMVGALRLNQGDLSEAETQQEIKNFQGYLTLAESYTQTITNRLLIMHGYSGSGKTHLTNLLIKSSRFVRIRSDIERKRLHGIAETQRIKNGVSQDIYSANSSVETYKRLLSLTKALLCSGFSVIVDATFLKQEQRLMFSTLAHELNIPFHIVDCFAPVEVLENRIKQRLAKNRDASDADLDVLQHQLTSDEAFTQAEKKFLIPIDTSEAINLNQLIKTLQ